MSTKGDAVPREPRGDEGGVIGRQVEELIESMSVSGVNVRPDATARLTRLAGLIEHWNRAVNLVSRKDTGRLVSYHFFDSASLLPLLRPSREISVLDVGGSNGLPGLVLSALTPGMHVLVRDGRSKRASFLDEACRDAVPGNRFEIGRVDEDGFRAQYRESFDLIVARAVTKLKLLLRWCMPLVKPGGSIAAYKGSRCTSEISAARKYFFANGGRLLASVDSPLKEHYNPLRKFALAVVGEREGVGIWARSSQ
jgi:16S rRNA (guanine527-N7)-methyltransferase